MRRAHCFALTCLLSIAVLVSACGNDDSSSGEAGEDDVLTAVTTTLEDKNGWERGSATVTLEGVQDARFAHGGVTDPTGSGALWFASLENGDWEVVWDGSGIVDCASLEPYEDFPALLLPQCIDSTGSLRTRE